MSTVTFSSLDTLWTQNVTSYKDAEPVAKPFNETMARSAILVEDATRGIENLRVSWNPEKGMDDRTLSQVVAYDKICLAMENLSATAQDVCSAFARGIKELQPKSNTTEREHVSADIPDVDIGDALGAQHAKYRALQERAELLNIWATQLKDIDVPRLQKVLEKFKKHVIGKNDETNWFAWFGWTRANKDALIFKSPTQLLKAAKVVQLFSQNGLQATSMQELANLYRKTAESLQQLADDIDPPDMMEARDDKAAAAVVDRPDESGAGSSAPVPSDGIDDF